MRKHRMTKWREDTGVSQHQLAREASVDQGWVSRVEADKQGARIDEIARICIATSRLAKIPPLALEDFLPEDLLQRYLKAMEG